MDHWWADQSGKKPKPKYSHLQPNASYQDGSKAPVRNLFCINICFLYIFIYLFIWNIYIYLVVG